MFRGTLVARAHCFSISKYVLCCVAETYFASGKQCFMYGKTGKDQGNMCASYKKFLETYFLVLPGPRKNTVC